MAQFQQDAFRVHTSYTVDSSTEAAIQTPAFVHTGGIIRVCATEDIFVKVGKDPVADRQSMLIPSHKVEYLIAGKDEKISVLAVNAPGMVSVTEVQ